MFKWRESYFTVGGTPQINLGTKHLEVHDQIFTFLNLSLAATDLM
jgi:hypothetical protein